MPSSSSLPNRIASTKTTAPKAVATRTDCPIMVPRLRAPWLRTARTISGKAALAIICETVESERLSWAASRNAPAAAVPVSPPTMNSGICLTEMNSVWLKLEVSE